MSFREKKEKKKKRMIFAFASFFLSVMIFTPFFRVLFSFLEKPFLSAYVHSAEIKNESENIFSAFFYAKKIKEENKQLKEKLALLEVDNLRTAYLASLLEKNNLLSTEKTSQTALVLKKNNEGAFTINKGEKDGVNKNDYVLSFDGSLVGEVSQVFAHSSRVNFFTKNNISLSAILFPENISLDLLGNGNALVVEINRDVAVEQGDLLFSQKKPEFMVGKVSAIDFDPRDPMKKIYISPLHSLSVLQEVKIISL